MEELFIPASMGNLFGVYQESASPAPLIILSHGFNGCHLGNQDFADYFSAHGFSTFCLDFCGGGVKPRSRSDGNFEDMTVLTEAADLNAVIDYFKPRYDTICLWGASQGGFISSYVAAHRPQDVKAMAIEFPAYVLQDDARKRMKPDGTFDDFAAMNTVISRTYSEAAVSFEIYDVIGGYTGPVLLSHGDQDKLVPLRYSERAAKVFPHVEFVVVPGQGHGYRGEARDEAMARELAFFKRECGMA